MKSAGKLIAAVLALSIFFGLSAFAFAEPDLTTGMPWLASSVQGAVTEDTPISWKDDFYLAVNKDALLSYEIQPGYSAAGVYAKREMENDADILAIFTDYEPQGHDAKLAKDVYDLFLDWDSRNALGVQPLKKVTDAVEKLSSIEELNEYCTTVPYEEQAYLPFDFGSIVDYNDSSAYIMAVAPGPLMLEDSLEYRDISDLGTLMKANWDNFTLYILGRLGYTEAEAETILENCYAFENLVAPYIMTSDESLEPDFINRINNVIPTEKFETLQGSIPILQTADFAGYARKEKLILLEPSWLEALKEIYDDEHFELIKDYMIVHTALDFGEVLDRDCFMKDMECCNAVSGTEGFLSDEQYAAQYALNTLSWPVSQLYCERYFTAEDKENVTELVHEVLDAYAEMLAGEEFISEETKRKAIEKLDTMRLNVLWPDDWGQYSYEEVEFASAAEGGTLCEAVDAINRFECQKGAEDYLRPVDKDKWDGLMPTEVNAFYDPMTNSVNMLAAFCRGEVYDSSMPLEEQYGKLGTIIGHEISHCFDGTGSQFDKDGNYFDWWTEEDRTAFEEKIQAIADYADTVYCWDGTHINGRIVTGEACADMGGMACILHIAKNIEDFDYDLFFRSYAGLWSFMRSYNDFLARLKNEHPPEYYRVNGTVQQFEEFYDCYGIGEGDRMYLSPEKRIAIW